MKPTPLALDTEICMHTEFVSMCAAWLTCLLCANALEGKDAVASGIVLLALLDVFGTERGIQRRLDTAMLAFLRRLQQV